MDPILNEAAGRITNALEHLKKELSAIRAGRANPTLIEDISVEAYGSRMKMMEVGTIAAPQHSLLTIQVWDASLIRAVEKAILEANIGLNPSVDGSTVRLPIPALTEERRREFVKQAHQRGEESRIAVRQVRTDIRDDWKKQQESGDISEDDFHRYEKLLQDLVDKSNSQIDEMVKDKEAELMQV